MLEQKDLSTKLVAIGQWRQAWANHIIQKRLRKKARQQLLSSRLHNGARFGQWQHLGNQVAARQSHMAEDNTPPEIGTNINEQMLPLFPTTHSQQDATAGLSGEVSKTEHQIQVDLSQPTRKGETAIGSLSKMQDRALDGTLPQIIRATRTPHRHLDASVQRRLEPLLDFRIPAVRLHINQTADQVARQHQADAVTVGHDIFFRSDRFNPQSPEGIALLGHEVTHVAQAVGPQPILRQGDQQHQEQVALQNEQHILNQMARSKPRPIHPRQPDTPKTMRPQQTALPRQPQPSVQTAATNRSLDLSPSPAVSMEQLEEIKEAVYRDLIDRIRTDFERGG